MENNSTAQSSSGPFAFVSCVMTRLPPTRLHVKKGAEYPLSSSFIHFFYLQSIIYIYSSISINIYERIEIWYVRVSKMNCTSAARRTEGVTNLPPQGCLVIPAPQKHLTRNQPQQLSHSQQEALVNFLLRRRSVDHRRCFSPLLSAAYTCKSGI